MIIFIILLMHYTDISFYFYYFVQKRYSYSRICQSQSYQSASTTSSSSPSSPPSNSYSSLL